VLVIVTVTEAQRQAPFAKTVLALDTIATAGRVRPYPRCGIPPALRRKSRKTRD